MWSSILTEECIIHYNTIISMFETCVCGFVGVLLSPSGSSEGSKIPCSGKDNLADSNKIENA